MTTNSTPTPSKEPEPTKQPESRPVEPEQVHPPAKRAPQPEGNADVTRAGVIWVAISAGLVVLVLLIIFILQNEDRVTVKYFGASGELSLGMALFIAAVGGAILVAVAGAVRILQLRNQRRHQRAEPKAAAKAPSTGSKSSVDKTDK
ncbi:lipopolysaccharide assembly protein LapA domain-containing protein [Arthrobacter sp. H35-D1]|uniref:lipopolysaccharide assembly protein LapA domain-containing protein n=1 Tax=Arthrobacter sp. H35-D1 TaxID=3046202 RepID=UPI0024BA77CF|nr:lipopolysaccharide assembly protein LapA domain-containing protein [Arthrobacter sp. H35-D1]MDJ0314818.1 lipopolysaccharide assembly protein LapA domain-containing protein [Arthrobacter sp. H35-D1]